MGMATKRRRRRAQQGQGLVELAISMPLLLLICLGTIDMGRMFFDYMEMRNAAVEGAPYGVRHPTDIAGITAAVTSHGIPADAAVSVSTSGACTTHGGLGQLTVAASREWTPVSLDLLNAIGAGASWSFTMTASSTMRCMT